MLRCFGRRFIKLYLTKTKKSERKRGRKNVTINVHCDELQREPLTDTIKIHDHTSVFAKVIM